MCVDRRLRRVLCLSSHCIIQSLPGLQGFVLYSVTRLRWPWVIGTIHESATLYALPVSGSPLRLGFMVSRQLLLPPQEGFPG